MGKGTRTRGREGTRARRYEGMRARGHKAIADWPAASGTAPAQGTCRRRTHAHRWGCDGRAHWAGHDTDARLAIVTSTVHTSPKPTLNPKP